MQHGSVWKEYYTQATHDWYQQPFKVNLGQGREVCKPESENRECVVGESNRLHELDKVYGVHENLVRPFVAREGQVKEICIRYPSI